MAGNAVRLMNGWSVLWREANCALYIVVYVYMDPPAPPDIARGRWAQMGAKGVGYIVITTSKRVAPMPDEWTVCILAWARADMAVGAQNRDVFWTPIWTVIAVGARNRHIRSSM